MCAFVNAVFVLCLLSLCGLVFDVWFVVCVVCLSFCCCVVLLCVFLCVLCLFSVCRFAVCVGVPLLAFVPPVVVTVLVSSFLLFGGSVCVLFV